MQQSNAIRRWIALTALTFFLVIPAQAYYHYVYYQSRTAPFNPIYAQFNLAALPNNTVTFYVSDAGPSVFYPNDSFGSVLGEIKQALAVWNSVPTSNLRVAFGGLESQSQAPANTPGADVVFDDLPGLLGMGTPNLPVSPMLVNGPNGPFVPITRSTVILQSNTNNQPGQSYLQGYFTTAVHEIGHALGLQHTWTGSAMSQDVIRNTSRARPIDADDIASLSVLYGAPGWSANFGSISGNVTFNGGSGVNLASVVAISATGPAVSTLTNPDGAFQIQGLPPGTYQLYVHALPPDAVLANGSGILLPQDFSGRTFPLSNVFSAQFFPNTQNWQLAGNIGVTAGANTVGLSFSVQARAAVAMYDMLTYGYVGPTQTPVTPAFVNVSTGQFPNPIFVEPNTPPAATPISVGVLGVNNASGIAPSGSQGWFVYFNNISPASGPRHLVFNTANDMYVLPDGVNFTLQDPPTINSAQPNGNGTVTVTGNNFGSSSSVYFDGLLAPGSFNNGVLTVTPPTGIGGQVSTLTVFNGDGQNSMFTQSANPQTFTYPAAPAVTAQAQILAINPSALPAGISSMVDITAAGANFVAGQVSAGFGTTDVLVNNVWVLSPTHIIANVTVAPGAALGSSEVSIISAFQVTPQPSGFQIQPANPSLPSIAWPAVNASTGGAIYPGSFVSIFPANGAQFPAGMQLTLSGSPVAIQYSSPTQINFAIPPGFPLGPAVLNANSGGNSVNIVVEVDAQPTTPSLAR